MNNREKATKAIRAWQARHKTEMDSDPAWAAQNLAGDLYNAGLLAQDPPTMADVDWSDEEHYLAGAYDYDGREVVMLKEVVGNIQVCDVGEMQREFIPVLVHPKKLTPNGKKYQILDGSQRDNAAERIGVDERSNEEFDEPADWLSVFRLQLPSPPRRYKRFDSPRSENARAGMSSRTETLLTAGDYEYAPVGTIVASGEQPPYVKTEVNVWMDSCGDMYSDEGMAGTRRDVLRKGW